MKYLLIILVAAAVLLPQVSPAQPLEGFVHIEGGFFYRSESNRANDAPRARIEPFEILDHPVTNGQFKIFVDDAGYAPPKHWLDGRIPEGKENHPVIFVNRQDVTAYLQWLSENDGRQYRLPTPTELEYAARGGLIGRRYPWGDADPEGRANFDPDGNRAFDRWQDYLRPAKWGRPNGYGLYGMAGNVWNMTVRYHDPATMQWIYRLEDPTLKGQSVMGGSWARGKEYLRCGYSLGLHTGMRHPDVGFRPIRKPRDADWSVVPRQLCAVSRGDGQVLVTWALLESDRDSTTFNVYGATDRNHAGFLLTKQPVGATSFVHKGLTVNSRRQYYVRAVDRSGKEGPRCEWVGVTVTEQADPIVVTCEPLFKQGTLVPIFGDLNGDGTLDCVVRMDNGNREMSQDPGLPVQLEAFTSYGRSLWRKDVCYHDHCFGSANNVPFNVWDMDGDGKAEIITRLQIGDEVYVAILNGMTGEVISTAPWQPLVSDLQGSSTRIHLSIAYLDGERPAVITQSGLYENEIFTAYDAQLKQLWQYRSFWETGGSGGHKIEVADVDGDGRQEVFDGTTCLNHDGTLRWSIYRQHPDIVSIHDYLPGRPGLEVFYIVESSMHAGVYLVDASSGEIIWKVNREDDPRWTHGHRGWTADIWDGSPGIECVSNRAGHSDQNLILFSADGRSLLEPFPTGYTPIEWDGDPTSELLGNGGRTLANFDGKEARIVPGVRPNPGQSGSVIMVADLYGDFRDELVLITPTQSGGRAISVVTSPEAIDKAFVAANESLDYRLWIGRNMGGGYRSVYFHQLQRPGSE